jgi:hypothetical protein
MEAELHRAVVDDTINYLWDRSAFPGQSLDDVYPRTSVKDVALAFKGKNGPTTASTSNSWYAGAAAATLAFSSIAAYNLGKVNQSVKASPETLL